MKSRTAHGSWQPENRRLLFVLALCSFFVGLDSLVTVPLLPMIATSAGIPLDKGVLLVTAYALAYMITAPVFGSLSDRWGRKRMIVTGVVVLAIGTVLTGVADDFRGLLVFRAITGIGAGMIEPSVLALVGDRFSYQQRGRAMGIVIGAMIMATLFGVPAGSFLAQVSSWEWTFRIIGVLIMTALVLIVTGIPEHKPATVSQANPLVTTLQQLGVVFSSVPVSLALLATFLWYGGLQGLFANIGVYYTVNFGLTAAQNGLVIMVAGLGSVLGSLHGGKLADRSGKQFTVARAGLATAAGVFALSHITQYLWLAISVHVIWATAFGVGQAALTALISELNPEIRGTVLSLNSSAMFAGMMAATAASAALLGRGFGTIGILCAAATVLVIPVTHILIRKHRRDSASGTDTECVCD